MKVLQQFITTELEKATIKPAPVSRDTVMPESQDGKPQYLPAINMQSNGFQSEQHAAHLESTSVQQLLDESFN